MVPWGGGYRRIEEATSERAELELVLVIRINGRGKPFRVHSDHAIPGDLSTLKRNTNRAYPHIFKMGWGGAPFTKVFRSLCLNKLILT